MRDRSHRYQIMSGHTALPWVAVGQLVTAGDTLKAPVIARCLKDDIGRHGLPRSECVANAEFIVRACNAHDDLLAALKMWVADYGDTTMMWGDRGRKTLAAIAKATQS